MYAHQESWARTYRIPLILGLAALGRHAGIIVADVVLQVSVVVDSQDGLPQAPRFGRVLERADAEAVAEQELLVERG
jgi:hypothetical protein